MTPGLVQNVHYLVSLIFIPIPWILDRPYYQRNDIERVEPITVYQANTIQNGAMVQERPRIFPRLPKCGTRFGKV